MIKLARKKVKLTFTEQFEIIAAYWIQLRNLTDGKSLGTLVN
jgi:hypothetical protein